MIAAELSDLTNDLVFRKIQQAKPSSMKLRHLGSSAPALLVDALVFQILRNGPLPSFLPYAAELNRFSFNWVGVIASFLATGSLRIIFEHFAWPLTSRIIKWYQVDRDWNLYKGKKHVNIGRNTGIIGDNNTVIEK
jgi:hypothetical protein